MRKGRFAVYILECADGSFYTGYTNNLKIRLKLHESGKGSKYVRARRPFCLVYARKFCYYKSAFAEECRIKRLTRKEKDILVLGHGKVNRKIKRTRK
ncbi:MAG: GIY-YIG nuclease family protein [Candidatus Omnitrophica bacterium]|nr:GIY-YIG nuclease family protein [Candidatus Omnitrophota bacterium]